MTVSAPGTPFAVHDSRKDVAVRARGIVTATVVLSLHARDI